MSSHFLSPPVALRDFHPKVNENDQLLLNTGV